MKNKCRFKKIYISLLIIIVFIGAFMLGACSTTNTTAKSITKESASNFDLEFLEALGGYTNVYLLTDDKFHKDYIVIYNDRAGSVAITPRLED